MNNDLNREFYENFPVGKMDSEFARLAGLEKCIDLRQEVVKNEMFFVGSVLEIGACEGRVIGYLLGNGSGFNGQIYAIERSKKLIENLKCKYGNTKGVNILQGDLMTTEIPNSDLGLWLFGGILEFSKEEQEEAIIRLGKYITRSLIIDSPVVGGKTNATHSDGKNLELTCEWGTVKGYVPSIEEMNEYSRKAGFKEFGVHTYSTSQAGKKRNLFILQRQHTKSS